MQRNIERIAATNNATVANAGTVETPRNNADQMPISGVSLPKTTWGPSGQNIFRPSMPTLGSQVYYQQMMASQATQARGNQVQQLTTRLSQLTNEWPHRDKSIEGKCWLSEGDQQNLECAPNELKEIFAGRENEVLNLLSAIRSLGNPATRLIITYQQSRYDVSLTSE
ncbi:MAG: hypothetical protein V4568_07375 [Pseudomonadota bacterium]